VVGWKQKLWGADGAPPGWRSMAARKMTSIARAWVLPLLLEPTDRPSVGGGEGDAPAAAPEAAI
jgi:hypothetical protein